MISMLLYLLIVVAIFALVWWALTRLPLPEPVRIVVIVVTAIVGILYLAQLVPEVG